MKRQDKRVIFMVKELLEQDLGYLQLQEANTQANSILLPLVNTYSKEEPKKKILELHQVKPSLKGLLSSLVMEESQRMELIQQHYLSKLTHRVQPRGSLEELLHHHCWVCQTEIPLQVLEA